ncbi:MAG: alpha-ketoglutarate-dependent dioxygenase AlkB, partial [Actinobacteria bacterium]|nr:alpha-ketoglutarate-dependent dioxygenase AlkB [Actinomycetota bacterium]
MFVMSLFQDRVPQGFLYFPEWISATDEDEIIREIDSRQFDQTLSRRVQHYGARYDYRSSSVRESGSAPLIPPTLQKIADRLVSEGLFRTA